MRNDSVVYYIDSEKNDASTRFGRLLQRQIEAQPPGDTAPVILCIGTDRVTGDSLGPLVGSFLRAFDECQFLSVYGTLEYPIHALNLKSAYCQIKKKHPRSLILAVDASLGTKKHIGYITLGQGSLKPGAGVSKDLIAIGDIFITGIINSSSSRAQAALQNTRLSTVTSMACCIAEGILYALSPQS